MPFDPITEAARIGRKQYTHIGALSWPHLEMSFIISAFKRGTYDDSMARLRRHVLFYWRRGYYKTSGIDMFLKKGTPSMNVVRQPDYDPADCTYLDALKVSVPKLRGSISEKGKVVYPLAQRPRFIVVGELLNLFGSGDGFEDMMNVLNQLLEEGKGSVSLVKMAGIELEADTVAALDKRGIFFNSQEGIMEYPVDGTLLGASRLMSPAELKRLENSGFLDRINVVHWIPDDKEFQEVWEFDPPILPEDEFLPLMEWNTKMWSSSWTRVSSPPPEQMKKAKSVLSELYTMYEKKHKITMMNGLRSARDGTNLRHLFTTFATIKTIQDGGQSAGEGMPENTYEDITYDQESFERVIDFLPEYVRSRSPFGDAL